MDLGAHSPAKYPTFDKKRKHRAPKKVPKFGPNSFDLDNHTAFEKKTKREAPKEIPEASKKKARKNLMFELPKAEGTVSFDTIVLVKLGKRQTMMHPASRVFSHGTYALYREKALHESCEVPVEHAQSIAKIHFRTQA